MSTPHQIIRHLAPGEFVSGQELADELGLSRAAIKQNIDRLRDKGLVIHSVHGRGYRLGRPLELLDVERIRADMTPQSRARLRNIQVLEQVDSTNRYVRDSRMRGVPVDVCIAEFQSAGRGRRGRTWVAPPYGSILLSVFHELPGGPASSAGLSLVAGVAVVRALDQCGCPGGQLKWPNDIIFSGAKLGGILIELSGEVGERCASVIGIGVNVDLSDELTALCGQPVTTVLSHSTGGIFRNRLAAALVSQLFDALCEFNRSGFISFKDEWESRHAHQGYVVKIVRGDEVIDGVTQGVTDDGALKLKTAVGSMLSISTGEVVA